MKKYLLGLFVVAFILAPWLVSFAQAPDPDPNPNVNQCVNLVNNLRYRDRDIYKNGEVSTLQDYLQSKGYLNNEPTGYFGLLTLGAVKSFQNANSIVPVSGYVGPITRAMLKNLTCGGIYPNYNNPTISGVSGPQSLNVNQTGTWTVNAFDPNGGNLSYSVDWGDNMVYANGVTSLYPQPSVQQSATFTHSYSQPGTYTVRFTVTNYIECFMAPCPSGGSASTSLSVNVGGITPSSAITVLSPNGGETLYKGNNQTISWKDDMSFNCQNGASCAYLIKYYDIYLNYYQPPCLAGQLCPLMAIAPYTIAKNVYGSSYTWQVGNVILSGGSIFTVSNGTYKVTVCRSGTNINVCDSSDNPFTIQ
jgi:peptidoglycan hydrolase-like protein with peptidoglycan-binding domain